MRGTVPSTAGQDSITPLSAQSYTTITGTESPAAATIPSDSLLSTVLPHAAQRIDNNSNVRRELSPLFGHGRGTNNRRRPEHERRTSTAPYSKCGDSRRRQRYGMISRTFCALSICTADIAPSSSIVRILERNGLGLRQIHLVTNGSAEVQHLQMVDSSSVVEL